ncbi:MAG: hypothetical protein H6707_09000 [Deltaproteobacteria bacterium]|nr:hypothetical protein [Deltaproteobacteria bacterium]
MKVGILGAMLLLSASAANAANSKGAFFGSRAAMTGAALSAASAGTDASWYNPAGLAALTTTRIELSLSALSYRLQQIKDGVSIDLPSGIKREKLGANEFVVVPSALVFARQLTARVTLGLGVFATDSSDLRVSSNQQSSGEQDAQLGQVDSAVNVEAQALGNSYYLGPALGIRLGGSLRLGVSLFVAYARQLYGSKFVTQLRRSGAEPAFASYVESADMRYLGLLASVGLQWQPLRWLHIGAVLRSPLLALYIWGDYSALSTVHDVNGQAAAENESREIANGTLEQGLPLSAELQLAIKTSRWSVGAVIELSPPLSARGELQNEVGLLWNLAVGALVDLPADWQIGAGFYTDNSPSKGIAGFLDVDIDYYGINAGFQRATVFKSGGRRLILSTAIVVGYAVGSGQVGTLAYAPLRDQAQTVARDATFHELTLHVGSGLTF